MQRGTFLQLFLNIWAAVGPLVGVLIGSWLTMKNQRKLWLLDNKRAEYRRLLTTLTDCASRFIILCQTNSAVLGPTEQRQIGEMARKSANLIYSRLFIASEVQKLNVAARWTNAITDLRDSHDGIAFTKTFDALMHDMRSAANRDFS